MNMKTASLPSLRVDPELRASAESLLREGESLSAFMEQSLRDEVSRRRWHAEFLARGIAARDEAVRTQEYLTPKKVHDELRAMLAKAKKRPRA